MRKFSLLMAIVFASFAAIAQDQTIKELQSTAEKKLDDDWIKKLPYCG